MAAPMTPDLLARLTRLPQFPRRAADLVRLVGLEAAAALIAAWPGQDYPVPVSAASRNRMGQRRYAQLAEVIGDAAAQRIVAAYAGTTLSVPNCTEALRALRHDEIRAEADRLFAEGYSLREAVFELGIKHQLTGRTIEYLLGRPGNEPEPPPGQGSLF